MDLNLSAPESFFIDKEKLSVNSLALGDVEIPVPIYLPERRIFLYQEVQQSGTASFAMNGVIETFLGGQPKGKYPARLADISADSSANQSIPTLFNGGGSPVGDSLVVELCQPFTVDTQAVTLQPLRINAQIDLIRFRLVSIAGSSLLGWRVYLAALCTKY